MTKNASLQATILHLSATDTTRHAHPTQVSWSQIKFVDTPKCLIATNSRYDHESNHELCFVSRKISSEQKGLNGIHHRMLEGARHYTDVVNSVMCSISDDYIVCYDAKTTKQLLANAGAPVDDYKFICLLSIVKKLYPDMGSYTIPTLIYEFCENTAISYMPHNNHGRYDATFIRYILRQACVLNNLYSMDDLYYESQVKAI